MSFYCCSRGYSMFLHTALVVTLVFTISCGGRPGTSSSNSSIAVRVSAGSPVVGATVTIYAVSDATAEVNTVLGTAGVIGTGGPTDQDGKATVNLSMTNYSGPIQVVAGGAGSSFVDPCIPASSTSTPPTIQIPSDFTLSTYVATYSAGSSPTVAVTLLTTLADREAKAYAKGKHPLHPGAKALSAALVDRDALFVKHVTTVATAWNPANLRVTPPAALGKSAQTLVDVAYAALFDYALNQLGHEIALKAGYAADSTAINAISLTQLLIQDLDADGRFDGRGTSGLALSTQGTTPIAIDSQTLRKPLGIALDKWVQNGAVNLSGIKQADLVSAGVYNAITQDGSDLFPDGPASSFDPTDRAPPALSLATTPAAYIQQTSVNLQITATDATGVKAVHVRSGSTTYNATLNGSTWNVDGVALQAGSNSVTVWAEDTADPQNSGQGGVPPYQLTVPILVDSGKPVPTLDGTFASYYDESGINIAVDATGRAAVPPQYTYATTSKVILSNGTPIRKISTRLGWTDAPMAAQLETDNPGNIPTLRFAVPFSSQTDAPITTATFSVSVLCESCSVSSISGDLWSSSQTAEGLRYYLLPVASNLLPGLRSVVGETTLSVTINITDASGNVGSGQFSFPIHVIGPPLALSTDSNYHQKNDSNSTYPYTISSGTYTKLFDSGAYFLDGVVRLAHYYITNPAPVPVAITMPNLGTWAISETWSGVNDDSGYGDVTSESCSSPPCATGCVLTSDPSKTIRRYPYPEPLPGPQHNCDSGYWYPSTHNPVVEWRTDPGVPNTIHGDQVMSQAYLEAYVDSGSPQTDANHPGMTGNGRYVVPAANDYSPGVLSLYVVRPVQGLNARSIPFGGSNTYRQEIGDGLGHFLSPVGAHVENGWCYGSPAQGITCPGGNPNWAYLYYDHWYYRQLTANVETLAALIQVESWSIGAQGVEFGEAGTSLPVPTLALSVVH